MEITTTVKIWNNHLFWLTVEFSVFSDYNTWLKKLVLLAAWSLRLLVSLRSLVLVFQQFVVWRRKHLFWCQFKVVIIVWTNMWDFAHPSLCVIPTRRPHARKIPSWLSVRSQSWFATNIYWRNGVFKRCSSKGRTVVRKQRVTYFPR